MPIITNRMRVHQEDWSEARTVQSVSSRAVSKLGRTGSQVLAVPSVPWVSLTMSEPLFMIELRGGAVW
jgi:hypothetical protein